MRTDRPRHLQASEYLGPRQYFLTFCTHERRRHFITADAVQTVRTQIERAAGAQKMAVLAYCYMPDHVHLLAEGKAQDSDCLLFIARAKQFSGFHYKAKFGHPLWQRYGFEHIVRSEEATVSVARYIMENPVRARLVNRIENYPFSGSRVYTVEQILEAIQLPERWYRRSGPAEAGHHTSG